MDSGSNDKKKNALPRGLIGVLIGLGVGIALGVALDNVAVGMAVGIGVGIALASGLFNLQRERDSVAKGEDLEEPGADEA